MCIVYTLCFVSLIAVGCVEVESTPRSDDQNQIDLGGDENEFDDVAEETGSDVASLSSAAGLSCTSDTTVNKYTLTCSYNGHVRGRGIFFTEEEPEILRAMDLYQDGSGITVNIIWPRADDGALVSARVRDAMGSTSKRVWVPEHTLVAMYMCLDGGTCSKSHHFVN